MLPKSRRVPPPLSDHDQRLIAAALRKNGNNRKAAAPESGYSMRKVCQYCVEHHVPLPYVIFDRTRKCGPDSKGDLILASLAKHGNDAFAVVAETGCAISTVRKWAKRKGVALVKHGRCSSASKVQWNAENKAKLRDLFMKVPRPTIAEMAQAFDATESAIDTAASRFGYAKVQYRQVLHPEYQKPSATIGQERKCMICPNMFISESPWHRQCPRCFAVNCEIAA